MKRKSKKRSRQHFEQWHLRELLEQELENDNNHNHISNINNNQNDNKYTNANSISTNNQNSNDNHNLNDDLLNIRAKTRCKFDEILKSKYNCLLNVNQKLNDKKRFKKSEFELETDDLNNKNKKNEKRIMNNEKLMIELNVLCSNIENNIYQLYTNTKQNQNKNQNSKCDFFFNRKEYLQTVRHLLFNLKNNQLLQQKLIREELKVSQFVKMEHTDF